MTALSFDKSYVKNDFYNQLFKSEMIIAKKIFTDDDIFTDEFI